MNTKLLAIVGQGAPGSGCLYPSNRLLVWQDITIDDKFIVKEFDEEVLSVRVRHDLICVVFARCVKLFNFTREAHSFVGLALKDSIQTGSNLLGLGCLSTERDFDVILAVPVEPESHHRREGVVKIFNLTELSGHRELQCHDSPISCLEISKDGRYLLTASLTGTLIRMWDTQGEFAKGTAPLKEFRRGVQQSQLLDISFQNNLQLVNLISGNGTSHQFSIGETEAEGAKASALLKNPQASYLQQQMHQMCEVSQQLQAQAQPQSSKPKVENQQTLMSYLGYPVGYLQGEYAYSLMRHEAREGERLRGYILDNTLYVVSNFGLLLSGQIKGKGENAFTLKHNLLQDALP
mmetsp:Transcript_4784/g.8209  ORF Transcript_4784/g.8209 Transcript_4784/m.8209 type:complete len:349 (-) Transcript_4784:7-1053(-)